MIHAFIEAHLDEHIRKIQELVRQPSVSLEEDGIGAFADLVRERLIELGCQETARLDVGDGYPGVWGWFDAGAPKTILYYSHYDVRPIGQEKWTQPPFDAALVEMPPYRRVLVGRGALVAKGPLQAWLNALQAIRQVTGTLPVNVMFLIEGAEIMGSPNYLSLVRERAEALKRADALFSPGASQNARGQVSVALGYKGLIYLEIEAHSDTWGRGPIGGPVHSATNAIVDSPAWRLVQALATLTDKQGTRLTVPGLERIFFERKELDAGERLLLENLLARFAQANWNAVIPGLDPAAPVKVFKNDVTGNKVLTEYLYAPSVNISGLRSGYVGRGSKSFLLPHSATATIDIRTITDMDAQEIVGKLREHLDREGFPDVRIHVHCAYNWAQTDSQADVVRATLKTIEEYGYPAIVFPMTAFGGPWAHVARELRIPFLRGAGLGVGGRAATSDEFFVIEGNDQVPGLAQVERFYVDLLFNYASIVN